MRRGIGALLAYGGSVLCFGVLAIISIPIMIQVGGLQAWSSVAAGQAIGVIASIMIGYGWFFSGPTRAARTKESELFDLYLVSVRMRTLLFAPTILAGFVILHTTFPAIELLEASLGLLSTAVLGLRASWLYTGVGRPYSMLLMDAAPRIICIAVGLSVGFAMESIIVVVVGQIAGLLLAFTVSSLHILSINHRERSTTRYVIKDFFKEDWHAFSASFTDIAFLSAPVLIVAAVVPSSLPAYALIDRLWKQLITAISPFFDVLRSWVPRKSARSQQSKYRLVLLGGGFGMLFAATAMVLAGPWLFSYLSAGQVVIDPKHILLFGAVLFLANLAILLDLILIAMNQLRALSAGVLISTIIGLGCLSVAAVPFGISGVLVGLIFGYGIRVSFGIAVWVLNSRSIAQESKHHINSDE